MVLEWCFIFIPEHSSTSNDIILVSTARLLRKRTIGTELSLLEANKNEYFTRHLVNGEIVFCDHRISIVAGYMSDEVIRNSAFKFMHKDDVRWTIVALRDSKFLLVTKVRDWVNSFFFFFISFTRAAWLKIYLSSRRNIVQMQP